MNDESLTAMLADCLKRRKIMTSWEEAFIESIALAQGKGRILSEKQQAKLEEVWERLTDVQPRI